MQRSITQIILILAAFIGLIVVAGCSKSKSKLPILVVAGTADFGTYTCEILKAEGFNEFLLDSLTDEKVTASYLREFDLVILSESKINPHSMKLILEYVNNGGNLIAFRPDTSLAEIFGITSSEGEITEGYIGIDTNTKQGKSLTSKTMQFHGTADKYLVNSAKTIASLFSDKASKREFPGVVSNNYGKGHTVAFLYNLPKSIVYTRQGNPLFAGIEKDGIPGLRAMDLFTDGWLDTSNNTINQADEQMRLFTHCIEQMNTYTKPLPRLWYFPDSLKCLVTLTNDGEFNGETDFEPQFRDVDAMGAKMSIYILDINKTSKAWVDKWTAKGFEIAGHPDDTKEAGNPNWYNMDKALKLKKSQIADTYRLPMRTNVNHWFVWCGKNAAGTPDFAAEAELEEKNGIALDANYAFYDMKSNQKEHFLGPLGTEQGNYTGSGLVMKYAGAKGNTINVYQHQNAVYDQEYNESHDPDGYYNSFKGLMDRSLHNEVYSFISIKSHNDEYNFSKIPLMKMLAYANSNGIPVWTAVKLLEFLKMKEEASFNDIRWSNNQLSFNIKSSLKNGNGLTFMLPGDYRDMKIKEITKNGKCSPFIIRPVKGSDYAFITIDPGKNYSILADYSN